MLGLFNYLVSNGPYFILTCLILFFWDLVDLFVERKSLHFLRIRTFWFFYYSARAFFCIIIIEVVWALNLLNLPNKYVLAFITPFLFTIFLQNLVVVMGGKVELNTQEVFLKFRDTILRYFASSLNLERIKAKSRLADSNMSIGKLREQCRIILGKEKFEKFESGLKNKNDEEKKLDYIEGIIAHLPPEEVKKYVKGLIKNIPIDET